MKSFEKIKRTKARIHAHIYTTMTINMRRTFNNNTTIKAEKWTRKPKHTHTKKRERKTIHRTGRSNLERIR